MMRKQMTFILGALMLLIAAGCGNGNAADNRQATTAGVAQVLGEFDSYKDGEYRYYTLRNADLVG